MFNMKTAQIGILVVGISAATGVVAFMISKRRDNDQEIKEVRKKLEDLGHDVVVFHRTYNAAVGRGEACRSYFPLIFPSFSPIIS